MALGKKTGGRLPGTMNRATLRKLMDEQREKICGLLKLTDEQIDAMAPLDFYLALMRAYTKAKEYELAAQMADRAAPFTAPRLSANTADINLRTADPKDLTDAQLAALASDGGKGAAAPADDPVKPAPVRH